MTSVHDPPKEQNSFVLPPLTGSGDPQVCQRSKILQSHSSHQTCILLLLSFQEERVSSQETQVEMVIEGKNPKDLSSNISQQLSP
ncbi:hypothetical protein YC2023_096384 [Brassica napus]